MKQPMAGLLWLCAIAASLSLSIASRGDIPEWVPEGRRLLVLGTDINPPPGNFSFAAAKDLYLQVVDEKPYRDVVEKTDTEFCFAHAFFFWGPACNQSSPGFNPVDCCTALSAYVDEGQCLCHTLETAQFGSVVGELIAGLQCPVSFPVPAPEDDPFAVLQLEQCLPAVQLNPVGGLVPEFLGLTADELAAITDLDDLPTFDELYVAPPSGPFDTSTVQVRVRRAQPSILENNFSTPFAFQAILVYPANKSQEIVNPRTQKVSFRMLAESETPFPVIALSPGLNTAPEGHLTTMEHLASLGFIVISQASTQTIGLTANSRDVDAWSDDITSMLVWLRSRNRRRRSFLRCMIDMDRVGVAGVSMGGALCQPAILKAIELGINVSAVATLAPACVPWAESCDAPSEAIPQLPVPNFLFVAAGLDNIAPVAQAEFFQSLVRGTSSTKLHVIEGSTHCIGDFPTKGWPTSIIGACGRGTKSPIEATAEWNEVVGQFFNDTLIAPSSSGAKKRARRSCRRRS